MKKLLIIFIGLNLCLGLYAQQPTVPAEQYISVNTPTTVILDGRHYTLVGDLWVKEGRPSQNTIQKYIVDYADKGLNKVSDLSLTFEGKTVLIRGYLVVNQQAPKILQTKQRSFWQRLTDPHQHNDESVAGGITGGTIR